jgi:pimeloyl-ACP methyl ester carboxylesterase
MILQRWGIYLHREAIFESPNLRVFSVTHDSGPKDRIVISFMNWDPRQSLSKSGFGESLLTSNGIDALYFNCVDNSWWQYEDLSDAMLAARRHVERWSEVVTYGSSMGGYAAFRYAAELGADRAVAISPQFSIQQSLVPSEMRWSKERATTSFMHEVEFVSSKSCQYLAVYDPLYRPDVAHISQFKNYLSITDVLLPCSGHPSLELLRDYGTVSKVSLGLLEGRYSQRELRSEHRQKRRETPRYWSELAGRLRERGHVIGAVWGAAGLRLTG